MKKKPNILFGFTDPQSLRAMGGCMDALRVEGGVAA
jgi:hypothetical protein